MIPEKIRRRKKESLKNIQNISKSDQIFNRAKYKQPSALSHYIQGYYIANMIIISLYPIHRVAGLYSDSLSKKDWLGYSREKTVVATFILLSLLRYKKYCTIQHGVVNTIFYAKICMLSLYYIIAAKFFIVYGFLLILLWLLFKIPTNRGPNNFVKIKDYDHFKDYVLMEGRGRRRKDKGRRVKNNYKEVEMCFVEFWAPFAESCVYKQAVFRLESLLKFEIVNIVKHPEIAEDYFINTSGVSRQLPTIVMFEDGYEVSRFPEINDEGKIGKVLKYDKRELAKFFDLENRYFETFSL